MLARTIALGARAADRRRGPALRCEPPAWSAGRRRSPPATAARAGRPPRLDLIINELAHEFKNPLVTIKTFAHHLRRALPARRRRRTGGAPDRRSRRADRPDVGESPRVHPFGRAGAADACRCTPLLTPVLAECAPCARRARRCARACDALPAVIGPRRSAADSRTRLTNLVRALTRDLARKQLRCRSRYRQPRHARSSSLPEGADAARQPPGRPTRSTAGTGASAVPLGVAIANAVLERNGAQARRRRARPRHRHRPLHRWRKTEEAVVAGNGTASRTDR